MAETSDLADQAGDVLTGVGDEVGVLVPPLVCDVDVPRLLDERGGHDVVVIEVRPAFPENGVSDGADGHEAHGEFVVELSHVPGTWGRGVSAVLDIGDVFIGQRIGSESLRV
ncbi:hypothetical protein [Kitasatospora sp. NPDC017646]|uniref:hypothetical protein n=1 Tax=Kitasatospora sp. NPDC017646 TaxID=3364024 RepID=UPI0037A6845B